MKQITFKSLPEEVCFGTAESLAELGFAESEKGTPVTVSRGERLTVRRDGNGVSITYPSLSAYYRALSYLAGVLDGAPDVSETAAYTTLCLMEDCSRNAVMNLPSLKRMIRYLARMGYDSMMLYTEDTYELPEYPYFGYRRGRFTGAELREIDEYAAQFGIEIIPCIQTLAHLARALQWAAFNPVHDINDIMLAGDEKTYQLVETMLATLSGNLRSRRINLGMDEAHLLGRGKYLDRNGYHEKSEIMLTHLTRVTELCRKYGYAPMIWSDMFFRMAFDGRYYVEEGEVPPEVTAKVPAGLTLIYWDYYSLKRDVFTHMLDCHKKFPNNDTAFAGGAWCWSGFAPHNRFSLLSTEMQLEVCAERGMKNIIVTAWGDNGRECSNFAVLAVLLYFAEYGYAGKPDAARLESRARACFDIGFEDLLTLDAPNELPGRDPKKICNPCKYLLFNDPLEGILDSHMEADTVAAGYREAEKRLSAYVSHPVFGYMYETLASLCHVLSRKADLGLRLRGAYGKGDRAALAAIAAEIPVITEDLDAFLATFRRQWYKENKTYGFVVQELRIGGLRARLAETKQRVEEYLAGKTDSIREFEDPVLPFDCRERAEGETPYIQMNHWTQMATACTL